MKKRSLAAFVAALILGLVGPAQASGHGEAPSAVASGDLGREAFDLAVLRPLQFVQVVAHAVVFVPVYPLSLPFGGGEEMIELCIEQPIERLTRPLGAL